MHARLACPRVTYSDSSLSPVNFYRFSEFQWKFLNPSNHFQNRLRHSDYERLFDELGLLPIEIKTGEFPFSSMEGLPVHESFRRYGRKDLLTSIGYFSLASRAGVYPPAARHPGKVRTGGSECRR